ncbi:GAF domain-containing sensor histidine kinase [Massilia putida]|uniref:GAF domain-containing sensor histidine kinase n=1 Tax=Massilia putida TaxID=1141883 RepID=UPI000950F85F|nr:GAF domain-containing sensor histidine kinase [Massilia putida]
MSSTPASEINLSFDQLKVFRQAALILTSSQDLDEALNNTIAACLPALGDFGFFDVALQNGVRRTARAHQDPALEQQLKVSRWQHNGRSDINLCALSSGMPVLHENTDDDWFAHAFPGISRTLQFRSMLSVPVVHGEDLIGSLTLFMAGSGRNHGAADLNFATEISALAAPVVAKARMIAQQRATEIALRTSEQRFQLALRMGGMGAWQWDVLSNTVHWWPGMAELHGLSPGTQLQGVEDYLDLVHPDDRTATAVSMSDDAILSTGKALEYRILWPDGSVRWLETRWQNVHSDDGEWLSRSGICVDITQRMLTEQKLRFVARVSAELAELVEHEETLKRVAHLAVPDFADWCAVDLLGDTDKLIRVAVAHADPAKVRLAYDLHERYPPDPASDSGTWHVIRSGKSVLMAEISDETLAKSIGDPTYLQILRDLELRSYIGVPLVARGRTIGVLTFIFAESRRRYNETDVELAEEIGRRAGVAIDNSMLYRTLQENDRHKDEFLAMLSHELRNPLAPISTAAEMLRMIGHDDPKVMRASDVIARQVKHLNALVSDLLDVSRVTRGLVKLSKEVVDLKCIVENAIEQCRPLLDSKKHVFTLQVEVGQAWILGDQNRLVQVVVNLLNNAAKYTPEAGKITLSLRTAGHQAWIEVKDNGIGIEKEFLPHVFNLFTQAARSLDRAQGGLGIGLALVKTIIGLHGGEIVVCSAGANAGSTFTVSLPLCDNRGAEAVAPAYVSSAEQV